MSYLFTRILTAQNQNGFAISRLSAMRVKPVNSLGICIFTTLYAGTVAAVKKIVRYLLIAWLAVLSGGANAHVTQDAAHQATAKHDHALHGTQNQSAVVDAMASSAATPDANHADVRGHSHCGHGHTAGPLEPHEAFVKVLAATCAPTSHVQWASSTISSTIERPKWLFTTPAVVSLLS